MADTTLKNMGRRQMPRCQGDYCLRRVDQPGDTLCRVCAGRESVPAKKTRWRHIVRRS